MSEQVKMLRTYNQWRRGEIEGSMDDLGLHPTEIGKAIDAVLDDYATLQAECERYKSAFNEWHEKTSWVQQTATAKELCKHRADVLRDRIESLQSECEILREQVKALQSAENSYQPGFNAGRKASAKFADDWRKYCETLREEIAAIKTQEHVAEVSTLNGQPLGVPMLKNGKWTLVPGQKLYAMPLATPRATLKNET